MQPLVSQLGQLLTAAELFAALQPPAAEVSFAVSAGNTTRPHSLTLVRQRYLSHVR